MSERMKKPRTSYAKSSSRTLTVREGKVEYAIPREVARRYIVGPNKEISAKADPKITISAETIFAEIDSKLGSAGALLKGLRARENLTQVEFAKIIGVSQTNLSKMENGSRSIGKQMAKRIAVAFGLDYRMFL